MSDTEPQGILPQNKIDAIRRSFSEIADKPPPPDIIKGDELTFAHEGGHLVAALAANKKVFAYNIAGKLKWISKTAPSDKQRIVKAALSHHEGVVSYDTLGLSPEDERVSAAAGCAGELVYFNQIESTVAEQEHDRRKGSFKTIMDIQEVADTLADRFESGDLRGLYVFVMSRMAKGEGFDDINELIGLGCDIKTIFRSVQTEAQQQVQ